MEGKTLFWVVLILLFISGGIYTYSYLTTSDTTVAEVPVSQDTFTVTSQAQNEGQLYLELGQVMESSFDRE